jgi:hypothetical protein
VRRCSLSTWACGCVPTGRRNVVGESRAARARLLIPARCLAQAMRETTREALPQLASTHTKAV